MSDPLALVPLAAAARGGRVDDVPVQQLAAAGLTLLQRCAPLVRALSGRRAAILLPSTAGYLTALAASEGRGAVLVNPLGAPPEIGHQLADADVGAVFTIGELEGKLPPDVPRVLLDDAPRVAHWRHGAETRAVDLGSHIGLELAGDADAPGRDEEAVIVYTSAMAGTPLGAILTHANLLSNARGAIQTAQLTSSDHSLALLPFAHLFGFTITLLSPLLAGGRVTTLPRFNPVRALELLEAGSVTLVVGVPSIFKALLALLERRGVGGRLRSAALRICICGGAPLEREVQDRWAEVTGTELRQGYGLTEAGPVSLFNDIARPNRRGFLGEPFPGCRVQIRELDSEREVADGDGGEICVSGRNVFAGYVSGNERGLAVRDGWLRTGDLGARHESGSIAFHGVRKAMFTRNGFNIYPREIELAVQALPGVRSVRVHAAPDPARENEIALDIVGDVERDVVERWCAERLAIYKQPTRIAITRP